MKRTVYSTDWKNSYEIEEEDIIGIKIEEAPWKDADGFLFKHTLRIYTSDGSEYFMNHYVDATKGPDRMDFARELRSLANSIDPRK